MALAARGAVRGAAGPGLLEMNDVAISNSHVRALKADSHRARPSPVNRSRTSSKHHMIVARLGTPLAVSLNSGNSHDVTQLMPRSRRSHPSSVAVAGSIGNRTDCSSTADTTTTSTGTPCAPGCGMPKIIRRGAAHDPASARCTGPSNAPSPGCTTFQRLLVRSRYEPTYTKDFSTRLLPHLTEATAEVILNHQLGERGPLCHALRSLRADAARHSAEVRARHTNTAAAGVVITPGPCVPAFEIACETH